MSAGWPWACTAMIAWVRSVISASTSVLSRVNVRGSTSQNTGSAPWWIAANAEATKV